MQDKVILCFLPIRFFEYVTIRRFTPECISYLKSLPYEVLRNVSKTLECTQEENMALEITWAELRNDPNYIR